MAMRREQGEQAGKGLGLRAGQRGKGEGKDYSRRRVAGQPGIGEKEEPCQVSGRICLV